MEHQPLPTEPNGGRTTRGTFAAGNKFATGNPHASKVQKLRTALLAAMTEADLQAIVAKLTDLARDGDIRAAKLLLDTIGRPDDRPPAAANLTRTADEIRMLHSHHNPPADETARKAMIRQIADRVRQAREDDGQA